MIPMGSNSSLETRTEKRKMNLPAPAPRPASRLAFGVPALLTGGGILLLTVQGFTFFGLAAFALGIITGLITWGIRKLSEIPDSEAQPDPLRALRQRFHRASLISGAESASERALRQFETLTQTQKLLETALTRKFSPSELTYQRYQTAAEGVRRKAIERLEKVAEALESLKAEDASELESRLRDLAPDHAERSALEERLRLKRERIEQADRRISNNELALTEMERVLSAITELETQPQNATYEQVLAELEALARRAEDYSSVSIPRNP
jgi:hypothetical protein